MRTLPFLLLVPALALAQVTTNDNALNALAPAAKPQTATPAHRATRHTRAKPHAAPAKPALVPPPVAAAPPPNPVIQPAPFIMPAHPPPPPPPVPVKRDAAGTATPLAANGLRITFGPNSADLNPATEAALRQVASQALAHPEMEIFITAWAPGTPDDPSTPRRLSLDRALAARAVLLRAGLVSDRIHAIAKGFNDIGTAPPDRLDVTEILPAPSTPPPIKPAEPAAGAPAPAARAPK